MCKGTLQKERNEEVPPRLNFPFSNRDGMRPLGGIIDRSQEAGNGMAVVNMPVSKLN